MGNTSKSGSGRNIRPLMYGSRLNFSLVVAIMVASSFVTMALVAIGTKEAIQVDVPTVVEQTPNINAEATAFVSDQPEASDALGQVILQNFKDQNREQLTFIAPIVIASSGVLAYMLARYMTRPIRKAYEAQERFLQDAAHELRNPLAALKVTTQNLRSKKTITKTDALKLLKTTESQVDRLIKINENLLYLDKTPEEEQPQHVNLSELTTDVLEDLTPLANKKQLRIFDNIDPNIVRRVEADDYVRLVRNVLENAIKYSTVDSKEIRLGLSEKNSKVRLSVRDFGIGIPEAQLHQLGQRFFRASNTSSFEGSGLGMAIMQKIVSKYGGALTVNSKEGEGTHVVVNL